MPWTRPGLPWTGSAMPVGFVRELMPLEQGAQPLPSARKHCGRHTSLSQPGLRPDLPLRLDLALLCEYGS